MRLARVLEERLAAEASLFRAQLLREDLARIAKLRELAASPIDRAAFTAAAARLGWTQGDQRTPELAPVLGPFVEAVYDYERGEADAATEDRLEEAWAALTRERLTRLVGCLSNPVPPPE